MLTTASKSFLVASSLSQYFAADTMQGPAPTERTAAHAHRRYATDGGGAAVMMARVDCKVDSAKHVSMRHGLRTDLQTSKRDSFAAESERRAEEACMRMASLQNAVDRHFNAACDAH
uniref:Uncharacterized protein n=1 Tax=Chlamydomonas euryale TaxID=1486919 RepID=A0A7R9Z2S5_9CHLO|mmetsp:Transcript_40971/g.122330  ORF Transcript_40971/g.122330 Transcript_40971/m.122330 type:complete len:117 (+) Transcript_40971:589-939(+)|eukprot:357523-Chlamydomonas_euryale.AAC.8